MPLLVKLLENDARTIFTAASKAQAAVDYLREQILKDTNKEQAA